MATGGLTPIRGNDAYVGWAKQSAWGTAVPPTFFWRWLDGSGWGAETKITTEREGDTSPFMALSFKDSQLGVVKIVEYARPITVGCALQALLCSGSDTYTAPVKSSTLSAPVTAGATTFGSVVDLGNVGTMPLSFEGGYTSLTAEVATADLTTRTGVSTPWTYTLANAATFKQAHSAAGTIVSQATHALTRQTAAYDPYTLEYAYGHLGGQVPQAWRLQDAVCTEVRITGQTNRPIRLEHTWYGALNKLQSPLSTPAWEGVGVQGSASAPLNFNMGGSSWRIDGGATGNAATVRQFDITLKNTTDPSEFISEGLNPAFFQPANFDVQGSLNVIFQSWAQYNNTYFGSATPAASAADNVLVGMGSFLATFALDAISGLTLSLPMVAYAAAKMAPKLDGKSIMQPLSLTGQKGIGVTNPFAATLTNAFAQAY